MSPLDIAPPDPGPPDLAMPPVAAHLEPGSDMDTEIGGKIPGRPSDALLDAVLFLLAPLFLGASTELGLARLAALETVASYRARTQAELVCIGQIIAFGLAAMDTLRLSMTTDMSVAMKLRLRSCANGLNRSAQQNARVLENVRRDLRSPPLMGAPDAMGRSLDDGYEDPIEAKVAAAVAGSVLRPAEAHHVSAPAKSVEPVQPAAEPNVPQPTAVDPGGIASQPARPTRAGSSPIYPAHWPGELSTSTEELHTLMRANGLASPSGATRNPNSPAIAQPMSQADRMIAEALASVARQLVSEARDPEDLTKPAERRTEPIHKPK